MNELGGKDEMEKVKAHETATLRKEYQAPKLTIYGEIADLVLVNAGIGPDGSPIPPLTFS